MDKHTSEERVGNLWTKDDINQSKNRDEGRDNRNEGDIKLVVNSN